MRCVPMNNFADDIAKIDIKINRLLSQKSVIQHKLKKRAKNQRKARTRTLIQLGGLLNLTPLLSNIELGDDLQLEHIDKATMLLGLLSDLSDQLPEQFSDEEIEKKQEEGEWPDPWI